MGGRMHFVAPSTWTTSIGRWSLQSFDRFLTGRRVLVITGGEGTSLEGLGSVSER